MSEYDICKLLWVVIVLSIMLMVITNFLEEIRPK